MIEKETIKEILLENRKEIESQQVVHRNIEKEDFANYVLIGVRRAGKSFMLYQQIQDNLKKGITWDSMLYINFEDERLIGMTAQELNLILEVHGMMSAQRPILFLDEIQNIEGWDKFARRLADNKYRVYITGSNAKMLSRDIETVLGGRYLDNSVFPYSFSEYLKAVGVLHSKNWQYGRKANELQRHFRTYFDWGGFPELVHFQEKRIWLNSLYNRIFFNDLVVRHKIKNEDALRLCVRRLAESVKQPCSLNRLSNLIKATGTPCSPSTVMEYVRYLQESCLLISIDNYVSKFVEKETIKKHYFVDNGLLHLFINNPNTSLLENLCAITLYKKYAKGLYYYNRNIEVDFYVPDEGIAVQASYQMSDGETIEREVKALVALHGLHPLKRAMIITYEDEGEIVRDGLRIEIRPAWKWVLEGL